MHNATEWFENDQFWESWGPVIFTHAVWEKTPQQVDKLLALMELPPAADVLDLACGPGRIALELARRGFGVTGVDRTRSYLDEAGSRAADENLDVEFFHSDMRRFVRPGAFDAAICFYTSFGYFDDPEDDRRVLDNLRQSIRPGGKLLIEMMGKEPLAAKFRPRDWSEENGVLLLEERQILDDWSRIRSRWIKIDGSSCEEFTFTLRLYAASELRTALRETGFCAVSFYGALDGIPYDENARRLVAVATKP